MTPPAPLLATKEGPAGGQPAGPRSGEEGAKPLLDTYNSRPAFNPNGPPAELQAHPQFVLWRREQRKTQTGKLEWTKVPYSAKTGHKASVNEPSGWTTSGEAHEALRTQRVGAFDGIGIVLTPDLGLTGIDLDKVDRWPEDARAILDRLDTYCEVTPSGNGYRAFVRGTLPVAGRRTGPQEPHQVELYSAQRFLTLTGRVVPEFKGRGVEARQEQLDTLYARYFGEAKPKPCTVEAPEPLNLEDDQLTELIRQSDQGPKFDRLMRGDKGDYLTLDATPDWSAADAALCSILAWRSRGNRAQIERIWGASELAKRDKWQREDYRERTISYAIDKLGGQFYDPLHGQVLMNANAGKATVPQGTARKKPRIYTAAELDERVIEPARFAVTGLLAEGLNVLGGKPKMGKSWIALALAVAITTGGKAFGSIAVEEGDALYLALEDSERRIQERARQLCRGRLPERLHLYTPPVDIEEAWPRAHEGGLDCIDEWLQDHPQTRLVIVDTLALFRPPQNGKGNVYLEDYAIGSQIKRLADKHHVAILVVTHLRKGGAEDFVESLTGSMGFGGAADAILVIDRPRNDSGATLKVTGRDINEQEWALKFEQAQGWVIVGDAQEMRQTELQKEIRVAIGMAGKRLTPRQVAQQTGRPESTIKSAMWRMATKANPPALVNVDGAYGLPGVDYDTPATPATPATGNSASG